MELKTGMPRPAWCSSGPCVVVIGSLKLLLTVSGTPRAWGGWSMEKWGLVGWMLCCILSGEAAELWRECGSMGDESAGFPVTRGSWRAQVRHPHPVAGWQAPRSSGA